MIRKLICVFLLFALMQGCTFFRTKTSELQATIDSLSDEELSTLEVFFRVFFDQSQGGYVLYGNKPLCVEAFAYREEESIFLAKWIHIFSTNLKKGALLWKERDLDKYCKSYHLHICEKPNQEWQDLLLINTKELLTTLRNNLPLFQYVLGPHLTPEYLLDQLKNSNSSFRSVLQNDKVLIGILLGYGTQNALYSNRAEGLQENVLKEPSWGFKTVQEEADWLSTHFSLSTDYSEENLPLLPWFGCYDSQESKKLISSYVKTQEKIAHLLKSKNFLEKVLCQIFEEKISLRCWDRSLIALPEKQELARAVAQGIWHNISSKDEAYLSSFMQGLEASQQGALPLSEDEFCELRDRYNKALERIDQDPLTYAHECHQIAYYSGIRVWDHFKKGDALYSFSEIFSYLNEYRNQEEIGSLDALTDRILTHLHWFLYQKTNS